MARTNHPINLKSLAATVVGGPVSEVAQDVRGGRQFYHQVHISALGAGASVSVDIEGSNTGGAAAAEWVTLATIAGAAVGTFEGIHADKAPAFIRCSHTVAVDSVTFEVTTNIVS